MKGLSKLNCLKIHSSTSSLSEEEPKSSKSIKLAKVNKNERSFGESLITEIKIEPEDFEDVKFERIKAEEEEEIAKQQLKKIEVEQKILKERKSKKGLLAAPKIVWNKLVGKKDEAKTPKAEKSNKQDQKSIDIAVNVTKAPLPSANATVKKPVKSIEEECKFQCTVCSLRFKTEKQLIKHTKIHDTAKPVEEVVTANEDQNAPIKEKKSMFKTVTKFFGFGKNSNKKSKLKSDECEIEQVDTQEPLNSINLSQAEHQIIVVNTPDCSFIITDVPEDAAQRMDVDEILNLYPDVEQNSEKTQADDQAIALQQLRDIEEQRLEKEKIKEKNRYNTESSKKKGGVQNVCGKIKDKCIDIIKNKSPKQNSFADEKKRALIENQKKYQEEKRIKNITHSRKNYEEYIM